MITIKSIDIAKAIWTWQQFVMDIVNWKQKVPKKRKEPLIRFYKEKIKEIEFFIKSLDFKN